MIIYLAGARFSLAQRRFNEEFARILERCYMPLEIILPQDPRAENGASRDSAEPMYRATQDAINHSHAVVAILDGIDTGSRTYLEMDYAKANGKLVIGVRTDLRTGEDRSLNLMVSDLCAALIARKSAAMTLDDFAEEVADVLAKHERPNATCYVPFQHVEWLNREIA